MTVDCLTALCVGGDARHNSYYPYSRSDRFIGCRDVEPGITRGIFTSSLNDSLHVLL